MLGFILLSISVGCSTRMYDGMNHEAGAMYTAVAMMILAQIRVRAVRYPE